MDPSPSPALLAIVALLAGLAAGAAGAWFAARARIDAALDLGRAEAGTQSAAALAAAGERAQRVPTLEAELAALRARLDAAQDELVRLATREAEKSQALQGALARADTAEAREQAQADALADAIEQRAALGVEVDRIAPLEMRLAAAEARVTELAAERAQLAERLDAERAQAAEKLALLQQARETLSDQFRQLAGDILEDKSRRFAEQNQANLGQLLDPLRTRLAEFQARVEDVHIQQTRDRSALGEQVRQLMAMNQALSDDARNLARALKGDSKTQGNWGELILERVLESAGLVRGEGYEVQDSRVRDDGSRGQPDVVIHLPGERCLVVDAKVSLAAYDDLVAAEDEESRKRHLKRHLDSVRAHMRGLAERDYPALYGLKSLDCVLMFVPIEPAFMTAITQDRELFADAWSRDVLLVSPSTLMFVVRTVAHLWRTEAQNRNAQEIARRGAELYDRLAAFVADLDRVGERLQQAQDSWSTARGKLASNRGNVIRQAEMLRELGVKPTRSLPTALVERAAEADEAPSDQSPRISAISSSTSSAPAPA